MSSVRLSLPGRRALAALSAVLLFATPRITHAQGTDAKPVAAQFDGIWQGALNAGMATLRLGLTISRDGTGAASGFLTSIDQGNGKFPATLSTSGDSLVASFGMIGARFAGVISATGDTLRGTFTQGPNVLPLAMVRVTALTVGTPPARPQLPHEPFPYRADNVAVSSVNGVGLGCTLLVPEGTGPFPGVVFVTGSGPQDRDETLAGHKPFLVIADHLARNGIASLRCDDRGVGKSLGNFGAATSADFADDAESAVRWLGARSEIAKRHVGIIGHSEGGLIAPIVAARSHDVAFIVMMAGPGVRGDSIIGMQTRLIAVANGAPPELAALMQANNARILSVIRDAKDSADAERQARAVLHARIDTMSAANQAIVTKNFETALPQILSPWYRYFLAYDPRPTLRRVTVPVLAMNGTLDLQVPYKENLAAIAQALTAAGNKDFRIAELPNLNHLFQTAKTGNLTEYEKIEETVAPAALDLMTGWIRKHVRN